MGKEYFTFRIRKNVLGRLSLGLLAAAYAVVTGAAVAWNMSGWAPTPGLNVTFVAVLSTIGMCGSVAGVSMLCDRDRRKR